MTSSYSTLVLAVILVSPYLAAAPNGQMAKPDFIKGDSIPAGATHDWNLGATGVSGWIYSDKMETSDARQIAITKVENGSPSEGVLAVGDVVLGVSGKPFSFDPRTEMGRALTEAEAGEGDLSLMRWRAGKQENVVVKIPPLGTYSATAPYNCPKSKRIFEQGCDALAERIASPAYRQNPIPRSLNALALLASGDKKYLPIIKKEAEWAAAFSADSFQTWYYGYLLVFLSEYSMATGDDSVMTGLRRLAMESAKGQSIVGSWGHRFAGQDGRLIGYGMMNSPGVVLSSGLALARATGVKDPEVDAAIERSAKLVRFYIGKGAIPYGDHEPWIQTHEDNGKCGMASVFFGLLGEEEGAEFFSRMSIASHGSERDTGHTGNFFNILWAMPSIAKSGPQASGAWMQEFGGWYFDLARRWDGTFNHQGPPQMKSDSYNGWDATGAVLLAYAMPLKNIYLTGKLPSKIPQLNAAQAASLISDGRGWTNKDRNSAYDKLSGDQLFAFLGSWSPTVRDRAAMAIGRRGDAPIPALVKMLKSPQLYSRYGACQALAQLKGKAAPAVPELRKCLQDKDLWVRTEAAMALAKIGPAALPAVPELLTMIAKGPTEEDPRGMEQRFLGFAVFGEMLKGSLDGVDRDLLRKAVEAGLKNQDGRGRGAVASIYQKLSYDEIKPLLPAIQEAIITPAPSGIMFDSGVRLAGLDLFAKHRIREGMELSFVVMEIDKWGKGARIPKCLNALGKYGAAAKPMIPRLQQLQKDLQAQGKSANPIVENVKSLITKIESAKESTELRSLN